MKTVKALQDVVEALRAKLKECETSYTECVHLLDRARCNTVVERDTVASMHASIDVLLKEKDTLSKNTGLLDGARDRADDLEAEVARLQTRNKMRRNDANVAYRKLKAKISNLEYAHNHKVRKLEEEIAGKSEAAKGKPQEYHIGMRLLHKGGNVCMITVTSFNYGAARHSCGLTVLTPSDDSVFSAGSKCGESVLVKNYRHITAEEVSNMVQNLNDYKVI